GGEDLAGGPLDAVERNRSVPLGGAAAGLLFVELVADRVTLASTGDCPLNVVRFNDRRQRSWKLGLSQPVLLGEEHPVQQAQRIQLRDGPRHPGLVKWSVLG